MRIEPLIQKDCPSVDAYSGINAAERNLLNTGFLVVRDEERFVGILVSDDIVEKRHNLVADCLRPKPLVQPGMHVKHVFGLMKEHGLWVLPVTGDDGFLGVITQSAILDHFSTKGETFERQMASHAKELSDLNGKLHVEIEERRRAEEEIEKARNAAEAANHAKTIFLANVSHEIRTPLNAISGFAEIILEEAEKLPEDLREYLGRIRNGAGNLTEIISNVLDLSRIEAGKMVTEKETINIHLLIRSLYQVSGAAAEKKGVRLNYRITSALPNIILGDRTRINQILMNLVGNATKFTPEGRLVEIIADRDGSEMVFRVVDEGIGIPREKLKTIFDPFEQVDGAPTRNYGGTGLGLSIVRKCAELLGGSVEVSSKIGAGSTFTVKLPLIDASRPEGLPEKAKWRSIDFPPETLVLLAEDNLMNREMIVAFLRILNLRVEIVEDGAECVEKARRMQPHLILMDLHMPVMDGFAATRLLRKDSNMGAVPIIMLSADAFVERVEEALAIGVTEFVTKPVDLNDLAALLSKHLLTG